MKAILVFLAPLLASLFLSGCGSWRMPTHLAGNLPNTGTVVPDTTFKLTPSLSVPLEKLVFWGGYVGAAYLVMDPLAPNWEIEEAKLPGERYFLSLHMRRIYAGGAGEARAVFHRRASELVRGGPYVRYEVLEYSERIDSSVLGSQRVATGAIRLISDIEG